jgi:hypothetical protein
MLPETLTIAEATKGPSISTDTTNRTLGTLRKNVVVVVVLLGLVTNSLVSDSYSRMLAYVPESQSITKTAPNTTVSIAANSTALVFNETKSRNAHSQSSAPWKVHANHSHEIITLSNKSNALPPTCQRIGEWRTSFRPNRMECEYYRSKKIQHILFYESLREVGVKSDDLKRDVLRIDHKGAKEIFKGIPFPLLFPRRMVEFACDQWSNPKKWQLFFQGIDNPDRQKWLKNVPTGEQIKVGFSRAGRSVKKTTCDYDWKYFEDLASAQFGLAPTGDFPWTYRFMESTLMGAIPVVQRSFYDKTSMDGYDVEFVDSWGDNDDAKGAVLDALVYDSDKAIDNFERFVQQHTTLSKDILPLIVAEKSQDDKQQ